MKWSKAISGSAEKGGDAMFYNAMGLILADHKRIQLGELTRPRALAGVPFGGRYRIIDFMLSNLVNSGVITIGVVAQNKYKSLMDHLGTGSDWDLDRKRKGLYLLPPFVTSSSRETGCDVDDLAGLLDFLHGKPQKYVIVANSNVIFNSRLDDLVGQHEDSGHDMSVLYTHYNAAYGPPAVILDIDRRGLVRDMLQDPPRMLLTRCSMGVVVMARELLIDLISESMAHGELDFSVETLLKNYRRLKIRAFEYKKLVLFINSVVSYFYSSMRLLDDQVRLELFGSDLPVYTKVKDEAPALYKDSNKVSNCFISDGCIVSGSVSDSIIFRNVTLSENSNVKNCVIMQDSFISEGVELDHVILDKNCMIRSGVKLVGQKGYPTVIGKGAVV
jgi:glucose-1-phosphate adenylyltransferase